MSQPTVWDSQDVYVEQPEDGSGLLGMSQSTMLYTVGGGFGGAVAILALVLVMKSLLRIARPHQALVFSGKSRLSADGTRLGYHVVQGGQRGFYVPVLQRVDLMDMRLIPIDVRVTNAYSKGNIPLQIHAIANVKMHSDPQFIGNAIERFLGRSPKEVSQVAQQTLEGALREVLAQLTPEEVNEDRLKFADRLADNAEDDLNKLGLRLDTLKIQNVSDETGYLDSLGRPQIAAALRDAENAENVVQQEITRAQADASQRADVAKATAETAVLSKRNELRRIKAELEGQAQAVEREAEAAAKTARAQAEQELQTVRTELEQLRLQAEVVIPADMNRQAQAILAVGEAAPTAESGAAAVQVLEMMTTAWQTMGPQAKELYVIQHLEEIVGAVVASLKDIQVDEVHVVDRGDGAGLSSYAATYPKMVAAVMSAVHESTGVDVPAVLNRSNGGL
jgi:flotillin